MNKMDLWIVGCIYLLTGCLMNKATCQIKPSKDNYPLAKVKSARFKVIKWLPIEKDGKVILRKHQETKVAFARPASIRLEMRRIEQDAASSAVTTLLNDVLVSNGKTQYVLSTPNKHYYTEKAYSDLIAVGEFRSELIFNANPLSAYPFAARGKEKTDGKSAFLYDLVFPDPRDKLKSRRVALWLSDPGRLPLRLSEFEKTTDGWREYDRYDYQEWQVNVKLPASTFAMTPLKDAKRISAPNSQTP